MPFQFLTMAGFLHEATLLWLAPRAYIPTVQHDLVGVVSEVRRTLVWCSGSREPLPSRKTEVLPKAAISFCSFVELKTNSSKTAVCVIDAFFWLKHQLLG